MADSIFIQRRFTITKDGITLSDALVLPKTEYDLLTPEDIEALKTERINNHVERIKNPPVQVEPTKEEQIASLDRDSASLDEQKTVLTSIKAELSKGGKNGK